MKRNLLLILAAVGLLATPALGREMPAWTAPAALAGDRPAAELQRAAAAGDAAAAAAALAALDRRPPGDADGRARHHLLAGVALRVRARAAAEAGAARTLRLDAALAFLRSAAAGPAGGPLHGPALLEAAVTLRLLGGPEAEAAADRLLLEAEPLLVRGGDAATLDRLAAAR
ncbi:hypothetical protein [Phycisphaera mikurensis]|uniref:Uncharacterized protein n=1 Tax=Phycisphaera mikurensis (strain NBRC 102666 / KCTC 22515 / FYK2301M01) TaxID=1142394 RepID=I0IAA6_PHYMF|nr:hypothetical protein [Phycisphaera mikurensis]MBB6441806.1 hypothetical protein [Phycisphaera mikurensis]BAM02194.1 hypothetical protein PSMK_00350 [Phycisphaera mikurensis NBRC 102666]